METKEETGKKIRPASQAGRFYDRAPELLKKTVDQMLNAHSGVQSYDNVAALIVPHAGYYYSGNVAAKAYMTLDPQRTYKRIFLLGPSHQTWLDGASADSEYDYYATPLGLVPVDKEAASRLNSHGRPFRYKEKAHKSEHCLEVQLPLLQRRLTDVPPIVPVIISTDDFDQLRQIADTLRPYFNEENLFIISSDFSHYPAYEDACEVDGRTGRAIESGDVWELIRTVEQNARSNIANLSTSACGIFPIIVLMLLMNNRYEAKHLLYQNSGDIDPAGKDQVVGYHAFAFLRKEAKESSGFTLTDEEKLKLKEIAYGSIQSAFEKKDFDAGDLAPYPALNERCGAFVSLHQDGRLRGCIGHFGEDTRLAAIVAEMARAAAFEDPRFPRLRPEELGYTDIEISVLTPMRRIQSIDEFQLHRHGIYIRKGRRAGTFLPQVADEVDWTKEEFLGHCSRDKAGLGWEGWREAELYVYEAIVF